MSIEAPGGDPQLTTADRNLLTTDPSIIILPGYRIYNLDANRTELFAGPAPTDWIQVSSIENTATVSAEGGQFTSIKAALDFVSSQVPTSNNPWQVTVGAGVYDEDPFTVPSYTTLSASLSAVINANDEMVPLITLSDKSVLFGGKISDGPGSSCGVYVPTGVQANIFRTIIEGSQSGVIVDGVGASVSMQSVFISGGVLNGLIVTNAASAFICAVEFLDGPATAISVLNSELNLSNCHIFDSTVGIELDGANVNINDVFLTGCDVAIKLNNGAAISGTGVSAVNSISHDIEQLDNLSSVRISSSLFDSSKLKIINQSVVNIDFNDMLSSSAGYNVSQNLSVGRPERGTSAALGEGAEYVREMLVYTENTLSQFVDVSSAAQDPNGPTFTFPGVLPGNKIYISVDLQKSSDFVKFYGVRQNIQSACVPGGGEIEVQYWDGLTWLSAGHMTTESSPNYLPSGEKIFQSAGDFQTRFDSFISAGWVKNDPPALGINRYWIRFNITTGITTAPVFNQFKIHSNNFSVDVDGWTQYYGTGRPINNLPWYLGLIKPAFSSANTQDVATGKSVDIGRDQNSFPKVGINRIGLCVYIPFDCDTSTSIRIVWSVATSNNSGGDIYWTLRRDYTADGDPIYYTSGAAPLNGLREIQSLNIVAAPVTANTQLTYSALLKISDLIPRKGTTERVGDLLWFTLERTATNPADTHTGDVALIQITGLYTRWCSGGHF